MNLICSSYVHGLILSCNYILRRKNLKFTQEKNYKLYVFLLMNVDIIGSIIKLVTCFLLEILLKLYNVNERQYHANTVQYCNGLFDTLNMYRKEPCCRINIFLRNQLKYSIECFFFYCMIL